MTLSIVGFSLCCLFFIHFARWSWQQHESFVSGDLFSATLVEGFDDKYDLWPLLSFSSCLANWRWSTKVMLRLCVGCLNAPVSPVIWEYTFTHVFLWLWLTCCTYPAPNSLRSARQSSRLSSWGTRYVSDDQTRAKNWTEILQVARNTTSDICWHCFLSARFATACFSFCKCRFKVCSTLPDQTELR